MTDIVALLHILEQSSMDKTALRRLTVIAVALLTMTGRVTMLGISRWTGDGGSYRTIQRFFNSKIIWHEILVICVQYWFADADDIFLLAGDETIITKAGKQTHGLDRFYSSIMGKPVPGLAFLAFSLISVKQSQSYIIRMEQLTKEESSQAKKSVTAKKRARRKESQVAQRGAKTRIVVM